ncbi:MAG: S1 RNA-binding domain-containing protein [Saccharothrix sp.]|nr:S1 RNA-binding domain-containing protein [Saccharothrix sp.]
MRVDLRIGDVVDGRVTGVVPFGALVSVGEVPGLLVGPVAVTAGTTLPVRVTGVDPDRGRVSVEAV